MAWCAYNDDKMKRYLYLSEQMVMLTYLGEVGILLMECSKQVNLQAGRLVCIIGGLEKGSSRECNWE